MRSVVNQFRISSNRSAKYRYIGTTDRMTPADSAAPSSLIPPLSTERRVVHPTDRFRSLVFVYRI